MPWRIGTKVPINVYDGDTPVCQCHTSADALLIVRAVNAYLEVEEPIICVCGKGQMERISRSNSADSRLYQCPKCMKVRMV